MSSDDPAATRRESLRVAGGLVGTAAIPWRRRGETPDEATPDGEPAREDFAWLGSRLWTEPRFREHALAFARERGLGLVFGQPPSNMPGVGETVRPALADAARVGVDPWCNLGAFQDLTPEAFREDSDRRERHLEGLREVADVFDDLFDGGRVVLWQEAPVMGQWSPDGEWDDASVANLLEHGPAVFEAQRAALLEANPALDVGIFVHFPYVVDSKRPEVFPDLIAGIREHDAMPEFGFTDFYRGWYEKDVGPEPADAAVRSLVSNAGDALDGRDVFYMGQAHTINPGHTPSSQSIRSNLRAALEAGAAGVGWFASNSYTPTTQGFDPLVPNAADATFDGGPVATVTVARDRYQYAWDATLAARSDVAPGDRFDLWLYGDGFPFQAHRVAARTTDGDWAVLGDADGYLDGDYPYGGGRTTVFRALDRTRFLDDGPLDLRVETRAGADASTLDAVFALPWDPDVFLTAGTATNRIEDDTALSPYLLGRARAGTDLRPGETVHVSVPVAGDAERRTTLVHPDHADAVERLAAAERRGYDHDARFDLWLAGSGLAAERAPSLLDADGNPVDPAEACVVAVARPDAALYYGLARDRLLDDGLDLESGSTGGATIEAAYAMPAAGSASFRPPARAAALLDQQPDEVATYALDAP